MTTEESRASIEQLVPRPWTGKSVWSSTKGLVVCGVLAAAMFVLNLGLGGALVYATGIPGLSAAISGLFVPFFLSLSLLLTRRFGAAALTWLVYSILAIPTVLNGPPGLYKVAIGLLAGLAFDVPASLGKSRLFAHYVGLFLYTIVNLAAFWLAFQALSLPGGEAFRKAVFVVAGIFLIEGIISISVAHYWYRRRLSRLPLLGRLQ